jgi:chaperonin cofactor prefoldin
MIRNPFLDEDKMPIQEVLRQVSKMFISMHHEKLLISAAEYIDELEKQNRELSASILRINSQVDKMIKSIDPTRQQGR